MIPILVEIWVKEFNRLWPLVFNIDVNLIHEHAYTQAHTCTYISWGNCQQAGLVDHCDIEVHWVIHTWRLLTKLSNDYWITSPVHQKISRRLLDKISLDDSFHDIFPVILLSAQSYYQNHLFHFSISFLVVVSICYTAQLSKEFLCLLTFSFFLWDQLFAIYSFMGYFSLVSSLTNVRRFLSLTHISSISKRM